MSQTKEQRHEYYLKNKEKYQFYNKERYREKKEELLEYQRKYRKENPGLIRNRARNKRLDRLLLGISLLGGSCFRCKNTFDPCQYDFHHKNPEEKEFTIGENVLVGKERFINEVNKCILLCANCHRLEHKELNDKTKV